MQKIFVLLSTIMATHQLSAQIPNLVWAKGFGSTAVYESASAVTVDGAGDVYVTGNFKETVDFDPGPGSFAVTAAGDDDIFISKFDAAGNFLWARTFGAAGVDGGSGVKTDAAGNVYIIGTFHNTVDFDPGPGTVTLSAAGGADVFLLKLTAAGNLAWVRNIVRGPMTDAARSVAIDAAGSVYTTGSFANTADFDPGTPTFNLAAAGGVDVFVSKLDSAGNFRWAMRWGDGSNDAAHAIAIDGGNAVYTTGQFTGTVDFDPGPATVNLSSTAVSFIWDAFVSKLDTAGNFVWARQLGGPSYDVGEALAVVPTGGIYVGGYFAQSGNFDPGSGSFTLTSAGNSDGFITRLDAAGAFIWAKSYGGISQDYCSSLAGDSAGVCATGTIYGTSDLDPGPATNIVTTGGPNSAAYLSRLDAQGTFVWGVSTATGTGGGGSSSIAHGPSGSLFIAGSFSATADFDPWSGVSNLVSIGNSVSNNDIFVARYSTVCLTINTAVALAGSTATVAATPGSSYQWLACDSNNALIAGQTNPSFTATTTGNYAVVVRNQLCADTSLCTLIIVCAQLNTAVTVAAGTLAVAPTANATYQWLDCNNGNLPIAGQTAQSFTPTVAGDYAVEVRLQTCADTSVCTQTMVASVSGPSPPLAALQVYPNAFTSTINVSWQAPVPSVHIAILDELGRTLQNVTLNNATAAHLNTAALSSGFYFLRISAEGMSVTKSITKLER